MNNKLSFEEIRKKYPVPSGTNQLRSDISGLLMNNGVKIVVLDDDPTGIQTVNHCLLLTNWKKENLELAFKAPHNIFYILTNSRSLGPVRVENVIKEIIAGILELNKFYQYRLVFISRSDSTLRGHFPLEPDIINLVLGEHRVPVELPVFFIPAFLEQGRFTLQGVHYLEDAGQLIPVAQTEFSEDNVFPYSCSELKAYILEKSGNRILQDEIGSFSIDDLRKDSVYVLADKVRAFKHQKFVTVDALDYVDLQKFALAVLSLMVRKETSLVCRTSSSFPRAIGAVEEQALLTKEDLVLKDGVGLFVVGSHVQKTTQQLSEILKEEQVRGIVIDINDIIQAAQETKQQVLKEIQDVVKSGKTPVIFTSRKEFRSDDKDVRLSVGHEISAFLVDVVRNLPFVPTYLVAKGGITSNDILTDGLEVEHAIVRGQVLSGVPVIITGDTGNVPNLPYIIFPGNVGNEFSLRAVFNNLK